MGNSDFYGYGRDFLLDVQRGIVPGHRVFTSQGHNALVGTAIADVWSQGGIYVWLDAAATMTISSTNALDNSAGDGARTVEVFGLDNNYDEISEVVALNGQTPVVLANAYIRIHRARVLTANADNQSYNLGDIYVGTGTVTAGVPATVHARIVPGENATNVNRYTVPAGHTGYVVSHGFSCADNKPLETYIFSRRFGEVFNLRRRFMVLANNFTFDGYAVLSEKSDIVTRANVLTGTADVASHTVMLLVRNGA